MGALTWLLAASASIGGPEATHSAPLERWRPYIAEAAARFDVPPDWIASVMRAESGGRTMLHGRPIRSRAGAIGLMQLMPGTWVEVRARLGLGHDPDDPRDNIMAGAFYLSRMHARFGYPGLFAAYNAGPGRYAEHLTAGRGLPRETRAYVRALSESARPGQPEEVRTTPATPIFFVLQGPDTDRIRYLFSGSAGVGYLSPDNPDPPP